MLRRGYIVIAALGLSGPVSAATDSGNQPDIAALQHSSDPVKRGEYLMYMGDCHACHTAPGGAELAGGRYMNTPFGSLSTPNLTPDKETGIGNWTDDQFYRALHEGIAAHGEYLYPAFPFPWFTKVTKDDVLAIKAYLFSLKPVHAPRKENHMAFPFDIRTGLITWRTLFFKAGTFKPDPKKSAEVNRGAYIVEGLEHCGECHNKSKLMGASDLSGKLEGGQIEGFYAPNITSDGKQGVGLWKKEDIVTYLKTGSRPDHTTVAAGPMKETINDSLSHLSDADLGAIAEYLKSTAAEQSSATSKGDVEPVAVANTYMSYCSSCHQPDGKGVPGAIPPLAGNGAVTAQGAENVIQAVLAGLPAQNGLAPMPAFGQTMTDSQVAEAVNYARSNFGNHAPINAAPALVASLRSQATSMLALNRKDTCTAIATAAKPNTNLPGAIDNSDVKSKLEKMSDDDMLSTIDAILPGIHKAAPQATPDQITNALTAAYCPIAETKGDQKTIKIGNFAVLVYGQAKRDGKPN